MTTPDWTPPRSPEEILALYEHRKTVYGPWHAQAQRVREVYNGSHQVVLPGLEQDGRPAVANLLTTGLDQIASRIASVPPQLKCPPRDPKVKREVTQARLREQAMYGWWQHNNYGLLQRRRARHLIGYGASPVWVRANEKLGIPCWQVMDPLFAYPARPNNPDEVTPDDCIFVSKQSYGWLQRQYPMQYEMLRRRETPSRDSLLTVLTYVSGEQTSQLVISEFSDDAFGRTESETYGTRHAAAGWTAGKGMVVLEQTENRTGVCPVIMPGRVTLDRRSGQFDGIIGMYQMRAKLMALEVIAVEKGIFPDMVAESRPGEQVKLISGEWQDGRTGKINLLQGGVIHELNTAPGFQTNPTIDRIERAEHVTAGIPVEFGGESATNIRTGRRGDAILSATVDFPIQEAQELFAISAQAELKAAVAIAKTHFGSQPKSFYVSWKGQTGHVDYVPNEIFTTDEVIASFPHAGADINGLTIMAGQLNGMGVLSKYSTARMLPMIEDAEFEHDQSIKEALETALMSGWQQKIAAGEVSPLDAAWVMEQVANNKLELAEAIQQVDERVRQRQASSGAPGTPTGPVDPNSPEAQAGLAAGTPAEAQAMASIQGPSPAQDNLASLLGRLRQPQMTMPSERAG